MQEHLRTYHNHLYCEVDNLRDGADHILHELENLKEGLRDLQDGQRRLRDNLQNAMQQVQECLAGHGNLQERQDNLQNAVRVVQETKAELVRSHDDQKMECDLLSDKLANLEDKFNKASRENVRRQERRSESLEHTLALRNVDLADLQGNVRELEILSYDGQLLWKISDYARRRNDAVSGLVQSFYSPCFYTRRFGYKMCARIYLNGDGMGRGTHISIFFVVMRGEYDALLRWPFRQKVTFMLLDQDNVEHVIDAFRPDPSSSSFQRPRRETNIASGCPMFCSLAELNNHAYVRDDTMFLKIIVDTSDL